MKAIKGRQIYGGGGRYAQCPVVENVSKNILRIYFASRNDQNKSFITYVDVENKPPFYLLYDHKQPISDLGQPGMFDEDGMIPSSIGSYGGKRYLYYTGWSKRSGPKILYENSVGALEINDNGSYDKVSTGPLISKSINVPFFCGHLTIDSETTNVGYILNCWQWVNGDPNYIVSEAVTRDGLRWDVIEGVAISTKGDEGGICSVNRIGDKRIYCVRNWKDFRNNHENSYSIQYSELVNENWVRRGVVPGLEKTGDLKQWDGMMNCYPFIYNNYIFYNGNEFGKTGFGYAELQP